mmetsp:Transcript_11339/g.26917  ORF Transcript_11339/g.26917 Transcript_11339/m.26917 type:complete len:137 (-) Transcript_11339:572-982(-)
MQALRALADSDGRIARDVAVLVFSLPFESRAALMDLLQAALLGVRPSESSWGQTLVRYQLQWARSEAAEAAASVVRYVAAPGVNHLRAAVTVVDCLFPPLMEVHVIDELRALAPLVFELSSSDMPAPRSPRFPSAS